MGYFEPGYDSKKRFISYWHQINEIISLDPLNVLEIGIGNGMVSNYLKSRGLEVTTLDVKERLRPDIVASVLDMPLGDSTFDVVACYEVLEHMEYRNFGAALSEIYRVCKRNALISLPDQNRAIRLLLHVPVLGEKKWMISTPKIKKKKLDVYHEWEIGSRGYPLKRIISDIEAAGFSLYNTYRVFEIPYHRFFILEKGNGGQTTPTWEA
jgi:ubiquinone/menaquinone biosynthesis C-methylase UbiE